MEELCLSVVAEASEVWTRGSAVHRASAITASATQNERRSPSAEPTPLSEYLVIATFWVYEFQSRRLLATREYNASERLHASCQNTAIPKALEIRAFFASTPVDVGSGITRDCNFTKSRLPRRL